MKNVLVIVSALLVLVQTQQVFACGGYRFEPTPSDYVSNVVQAHLRLLSSGEYSEESLTKLAWLSKARVVRSSNRRIARQVRRLPAAVSMWKRTQSKVKEYKIEKISFADDGQTAFVSVAVDWTHYKTVEDYILVASERGWRISELKYKRLGTKSRS